MRCMHDWRHKLCAGHMTAAGSWTARGICKWALFDDWGTTCLQKICVERASKVGMRQDLERSSNSGELLPRP